MPDSREKSRSRNPGGEEERQRRIESCVRRWGLRLGSAYDASPDSAVYPAVTAAGTAVVLKIQLPHRESEHEAEALRRWGGRGAVQLLEWDPARNALLLERCEPGDPLSTIGADAALDVFTGLLPRLWVEAGGPFRRLKDEAEDWAKELPDSWERAGRPFEAELLEAALASAAELAASQGRPVLVNQDLHPENVLRSEREPWLVIDPKPLAGEREFSLAPVLRAERLGHSRRSVIARLDRLTGALGLNRERARRWGLVQSLAWAFEGESVLSGHVEVARWLREA